MRCKSCLRIFTQPSANTKRTQMCAVCRGIIKTRTKYKEMCEKTTKILLNRAIEQKIRKCSDNEGHEFIAKKTPHLIPGIMVLSNE